METFIGILLLIMAVFLVAAVLMQFGKDKNLSGAIAGGADTFFGKGRASLWDKILSRATVIVGVIFAILVLVMYLIVK